MQTIQRNNVILSSVNMFSHTNTPDRKAILLLCNDTCMAQTDLCKIWAKFRKVRSKVNILGQKKNNICSHHAQLCHTTGMHPCPCTISTKYAAFQRQLVLGKCLKLVHIGL